MTGLYRRAQRDSATEEAPARLVALASSPGLRPASRHPGGRPALPVLPRFPVLLSLARSSIDRLVSFVTGLAGNEAKALLGLLEERELLGGHELLGFLAPQGPLEPSDLLCELVVGLQHFPEHRLEQPDVVGELVGRGGLDGRLGHQDSYPATWKVQAIWVHKLRVSDGQRDAVQQGLKEVG